MGPLHLWLLVLALGATSEQLHALPQLDSSLQDAIDSLAGGYLPPPPPSVKGDAGSCPPAETRILTETRALTTTFTENVVSTSVYHQTIREEVPHYVTETIFSTVLTTVPVDIVRTLHDTQVVVNSQVETERIPGPTTTTTEFSRAFQTKIESAQVTSTIISTVVSTAFELHTVTETETNVQTVFYPSVVRKFVAETARGVDRTVTLNNFIQQSTTVTSQPPAVTTTKQELRLKFFTVTHTVDSPPVTSTEFQDVFRTVTVTSAAPAPAAATVTRFITKTVHRGSTLQADGGPGSVVQLSNTVVVSPVVTRTRTRVVPHPVTVTRTRTIISSVAAPPVTSVLPAGGILTAIAQGSPGSNAHSSGGSLSFSRVFQSSVVPQVTTRVVEVRQPCPAGYGYKEPEKKLIF